MTEEPYELLAIGGGPAGLAAVRAYREAGGGGPAAIVADEHRMPYSRPPLTKELLRGEVDEDELPLEDDDWPAAHDVALIAGRAVALDAERRVATLSGGRELTYRSCVLATGAEPARIPVPGADDPAVVVLRSLDHLRNLVRRLAAGEPVVVVGSGFIGCEIAASLRARGLPVTMVSAEPAPNVERLGEAAAGEIAGWLAAEGVELEMGAELESIERAGPQLHVRTSGARHRARVVVMAAGVRPRVELARSAGLEFEEGGLPADERMRMAAPGLLAAGDVCRAYNPSAGRRLRVEHWGDALGQGAVAGATAAGVEAAWEAVPGFWSTIGGRTLKHAAWGDGFDRSEMSRGPNGSFAVLYERGGQLVGVLAHDRDEAYDQGRELVSRGAPFAEALEASWS